MCPYLPLGRIAIMLSWRPLCICPTLMFTLVVNRWHHGWPAAVCVCTASILIQSMALISHQNTTKCSLFQRHWCTITCPIWRRAIVFILSRRHLSCDIYVSLMHISQHIWILQYIIAGPSWPARCEMQGFVMGMKYNFPRSMVQPPSPTLPHTHTSTWWEVCCRYLWTFVHKL